MKHFRRHFLSCVEVRRVFTDSTFPGPTLQQYRGDLQMHSEWSDGCPTVQEIADACLQRGDHYAAVTDHSCGPGLDEPHAGRNRARGGPDPGSPARPDHWIARGCDRQLGRGVCIGGSARCRDLKSTVTPHDRTSIMRWRPAPLKRGHLTGFWPGCRILLGTSTVSSSLSSRSPRDMGSPTGRDRGARFVHEWWGESEHASIVSLHSVGYRYC